MATNANVRRGGSPANSLALRRRVDSKGEEVVRLEQDWVSADLKLKGLRVSVEGDRKEIRELERKREAARFRLAEHEMGVGRAVREEEHKLVHFRKEKEVW